MNIFSASKFKYALLALIFPVSLIISSCGDTAIVEPDPPPASTLPVDTIRNLNVPSSATGQFLYYSLSTKSILTGDDTATNKWDLAIQGTTIRINGGALHTNGGLGAAICTGSPRYNSIYGLTNFDTISVAPTTGYGEDVTPTDLAIPTGTDNGWYHYNSTDNVIEPIIGRVLLIKTGDGKYAKIEILSYYKDMTPDPMPNPMNFRWYTFRFSLQTDGSTKLK